MPQDRTPRSRPGGSSRGGGSGRSGGPSGPDGRSKRSGGRPDGRRSDRGRPDDRRSDGRRSDGRRSDGPRSRGGNRSGQGGRGDDRRGGDRGRPEPRTEAERRAAEVRARRGPRRTPRTPEREQEQIESRTTEQWIDEGSLRDAAEQATERAAGRSGGRDRESAEVDPEVLAQISAALEPRRAQRLSERLASASSALDRERFEEARRMVAPLVKELPHVAAVHEVNGLAAYRLGRWRQAAQSLELAKQLKPDPSLLPVLADCYRALHRYLDVEAVWEEIKHASPAHDVMAEGRIVAAGAFADQGDLKGAIALMRTVEQPPKRVRDHHLRQWYVLADLYDRAGDTVSAARWFREIQQRDARFADVGDRLRSLGR